MLHWRLYMQSYTPEMEAVVSATQQTNVLEQAIYS